MRLTLLVPPPTIHHNIPCIGIVLTRRILLYFSSGAMLVATCLSFSIHVCINCIVYFIILLLYCCMLNFEIINNNNPIWHVISRSGEVISTNCYTPLYHLTVSELLEEQQFLVLIKPRNAENKIAFQSKADQP